MRQTMGKQKIEMKKVEAYRNRVITFSKRKSGIFKKMNEMATLCNVEIGFLVFSDAGKPYIFANPSYEEVFVGLHTPSVNTNIGPLVKAYKRHKMEQLMKRYTNLVKENEMEEKKEIFLKESKKKNKLEKMWWNIFEEDFNVEMSKQIHQMFLDSLVSLKDALEWFGKDDDGSSSGQENCDSGEA